jgi:hypothetical protein
MADAFHHKTPLRAIIGVQLLHALITPIPVLLPAVFWGVLQLARPHSGRVARKRDKSLAPMRVGEGLSDLIGERLRARSETLRSFF